MWKTRFRLGLGLEVGVGVGTHVEGKGRCGRPAETQQPIGRDWPRLEAALGLTWRWRGVLEGELADARPTPLGGHVPHVLAPVVSTPWPPEPLAPPLSVPG